MNVSSYARMLVAAGALCGAGLCLLTCADEHQMPVHPGPTDPVAAFDGWSGCTGFAAEGADTLMPPDVGCLEYAYSADATLSLKHINAGFNCCPGEIMATISFEDSLIIIEEGERSSQCDCQCLYDLRLTIEHLRPRPYRVRVIEPYLHPDDAPLDFDLDLSGPCSGRHCEERIHYPWQQPIFGPDIYPSGHLTNYSGCKGQNASPDDGIAVTRDCLAVHYRSDDVLELRHINAGFNCCPGQITASVEISGNLISIVESETEQGCRCDCLFDLDYRIQDLWPGVYRIHVAEPYARPEWGDAPLDFVLDLTAPVSDTLCAERTHHPWGLW